MEKTICELFAGVGGFRLGFDRLQSGWKTTWFSQWEPGAKVQWAHDCYLYHFGDCFETNGECHTDCDIGTVDKNTIPDHTLLVGGFPCQDYSVANNLSAAKGIEGKKGVLWWQIRDTLIAKRPPFCLLENVDRLLKSPASQRGRDFGIILACFAELGYSVEWRVINAAQYGAAQRRRRTFIFAYRNDTNWGKQASKMTDDEIIRRQGLMPQAFPIDGLDTIYYKTLPKDLLDISNNFKFAFQNAGYMHNWVVSTVQVFERETPPIVLRDILQPNADEKYYITADKMADWVYMKGAKRKTRTTTEGYEYVFSEGAIAFPDPWDRPGRTMLTSESTQNRSTHIVTDPWTGRLRTLTPVEAERLQGFDDDWTNTGMPDRMRFFCMGNALVVPMITRMGRVLDDVIAKEDNKMEDTAYWAKGKLLKHAQEIIGIPLGSIDKTGRLSTGKGAIGTMIEENWFGYSPNSEAKPDFPEAGVELKATPYTRNARGEIVAKERLVCNIINYMEEYDQTFKTSSFWRKCNTMLLMSYEHLKDKPKSEYHIDKAVLFSFPKEDLIIIEHDWECIMDKVRKGQAHEISEGDTLYLAACTKGASAASVRQQPFSPIPAKQRAYSLKASYMTHVLEHYIFGEEENDRIIKDWHQLEKYTFEEYLVNRIKPYFGKTQNELKTILGVTSNAKNLNELLLAKMLGVSGKVSNSVEFKKANIVPKTIRVKRNGTIDECMSFPKFDFIELSKETVWEDSALYDMLAPTKFLFVIFKENNNGEFVFDRVQFWNIPNEDLAEVGRVWERTVQTIRDGVILTPTPRGVGNNLPKVSESGVAHVRPHGRDGEDKAPLPDGRMMTKQCFWLNNSYIKAQIKE